MSASTEGTVATQAADTLVQKLLKALRLQRIACTVLYAVTDRDGKPIARVASNSDKAGTDAAMAWLSKIDTSTVETAARAIHNDGRQCPICGLVQGHWLDLAETIRERHRRAARRALDAARTTAGLSPMELI